VQIKSLVLGIILIGMACCANADEGKDIQSVVKPEVADVKTGNLIEAEKVEKALANKETKNHAAAQAVMSLKIEALKWKKQFYAQKSEAMQLKYMVQCWNDPDFQEVQRIGRETDKELKRLSILQ